MITTKQLIRKDINKWSVKVYHRLKTDKAHHILNIQGIFWKDGTEVPCMDTDCGLCKRFFKPHDGGCITCPLYHVQGCCCSGEHNSSPWHEFYVTPNRETAKAMVRILVKTLRIRYGKQEIYNNAAPKA